MNNKRILSFVMATTLLFSVNFAHSGRTDSNGGHKDNNNVSGLGYYHYHCGGNPPHLHTNGTCPYASKSSTTNYTTSFSTSAATTKTTTTTSKPKYNVSLATYPIMFNGSQWTSDKDVLVVNGSTYLPLTSIAKLLNINVYWNQAKSQVEIGNTSISDFVKNSSGDYVGTLYDASGKELGTYCGALKNGVPHGYGTLTFSINYASTGRMYSGTFVDGIINGYGILYTYSNCEYEGTFIFDNSTNKLLKMGPFVLTDNFGNSFYDYFELIDQL